MSRNHAISCALLVTVVNKGVARKVVKASKEAGAEGGTTMIARGTATRHMQRLLGIPLELEKELILTIIEKDKLASVLETVTCSAGLDKPGAGIAFILNIKQVAGICHVCVFSEIMGGGRIVNDDKPGYDLIVTIVNKDSAELVVESARKAGAEGGTVLTGRGTGIHEQAKLFGITIEPEKEIVLTLISREKTAEVLEAIVREANLDKPGKGIAFVLEVQQVAGINHLRQ